jgi:WD40 repeat protein
MVAAQQTDGKILLWDPTTGAVRILVGHGAQVAHSLFSRDGRMLFSPSWDGTTRIWDLENGTNRVLRASDGRVSMAALAPDGRTLATAHDHAIHLWGLGNGSVQMLRGHTAVVRWLAFSPDGRMLLSAGEDSTVRHWEASAPSVPHGSNALRVWMERVTSAAISTPMNL